MCVCLCVWVWMRSNVKLKLARLQSFGLEVFFRSDQSGFTAQTLHIAPWSDDGQCVTKEIRLFSCPKHWKNLLSSSDYNRLLLQWIYISSSWPGHTSPSRLEKSKIFKTVMVLIDDPMTWFYQVLHPILLLRVTGK